MINKAIHWKPVLALFRGSHLWIDVLMTLVLPIALAGGIRQLIDSDSAVVYVMLFGWYLMAIVYFIPCTITSIMILRRFPKTRERIQVTFLMVIFWSIYVYFVIPNF